MLRKYARGLTHELACALDPHLCLIKTTSCADITGAFEKEFLRTEDVMLEALVLAGKLRAADAQHEYLWYKCGARFNAYTMRELHPLKDYSSGQGHQYHVAFSILPGIRRTDGAAERGKTIDVKAWVALAHEKK